MCCLILKYQLVFAARREIRKDPWTYRILWNLKLITYDVICSGKHSKVPKMFLITLFNWRLTFFVHITLKSKRERERKRQKILKFKIFPETMLLYIRLAKWILLKFLFQVLEIKLIDYLSRYFFYPFTIQNTFIYSFIYFYVSSL